MRIDFSDIPDIRNLLFDELVKGNAWMVCNDVARSFQMDPLLFFKSKEAAIGFALTNFPDRDNFQVMETKPLLDTVHRLLADDLGSQDIDHYIINANNEVSTVLKSNPDHNPLHYPDGNHFTDSVIAHWEQEANLRSLPRHFPVNYSNLGELTDQLKSIRFSQDLFSQIEEGMQLGLSIFEIKGIQAFGAHRQQCQFYCIKQPGGKYTIDRYRGTLYYPSQVEDTIINGIDTRKLGEEMSRADWQYDLAESEGEWVKGFKQIDAIENSLRMLSHDKVGAVLAVQLWINHAPPDVSDKPGFIRRIERAQDIFPSAVFTMNTMVRQSYNRLKAELKTGKYVKPVMVSDRKKKANKDLTLLDKVRKHGGKKLRM